MDSNEISKYIDLTDAMARLRGNENLYKKLLGSFLASTELEKYVASIDEKDYKRAGEIIHGIKGVTGNLSLAPLFKLIVELMGELRNEIYSADKDAEFREVYASTVAAVKAYLGM